MMPRLVRSLISNILKITNTELEGFVCLFCFISLGLLKEFFPFYKLSTLEEFETLLTQFHLVCSCDASLQAIIFTQYSQNQNHRC